MLPSTSNPQSSRLRSQIRRALELHQAGKLEQAEQLYRKVLRIQPDYFDALHMLGVAALQAGRSEYAIEMISRAIRYNSNVPAAHGNLALAYVQQERLQEAVVSFERQIALQPDHVEAYANMASALGRLGLRAAALAACERATSLRPNAAVAHLARAMALKDLERYAESLIACERAIELQPQSAVAWDKRGAALRELGRLDDSLASHNKAVELQPDFALAYLHAGMTCLLSGDYDRGWTLYDWRTKPGGTVTLRGPEKSRWLGDSNPSGSTILLYAEQGFGDTLQFCRYATVLERQGAKVILAVPGRLVALVKSLSQAVRVVADTDPLPAFDWHCPLLSLPRVFTTTLNNVPSECPYLSAEPERVTHWGNILGEQGFKIGIAWQGSRLAIDIGRSFPLAMFQRLALIPGVRLISLQKDAGSEQLKSMPEGMRVEDFGARLDCGPDAFLDTAAIMANVDLVITSDTSIAHLAGALGRPTWVALKHVPDWRWLLGREDSPWYPSHRLFRQERPGNWEGVFERMRTELLTLAAARANGQRLGDALLPLRQRVAG